MSQTLPRERRAGAITFSDLQGRMEVLRVACSKCERMGQYSVVRLIERYGAGTGLPDAITADCPLRAQVGIWNQCGAHFPDLPALMPRRS
jgi:hypothetical protein